MPPPLPDAAWVLNAMYQHEDGPSDVSYDEYRRAQLTPEAVGGVDLGDIHLGGGLGRARHPGPGWRRLRWAELARRTGDPLVPEGLLPSYRCFPSARKNGSWPLGISPPTEGSLDRETWNRLTEILIQHSPSGPDTRCLAYYNPLMLGATDFDTLHVRAGRLGDAQILYDDIPDVDFSASNPAWMRRSDPTGVPNALARPRWRSCWTASSWFISASSSACSQRAPFHSRRRSHHRVPRHSACALRGVLART